MSKNEIILRNELCSTLLRLNYNVFIPVFDEGVDLIAYREIDGDLRVVQQKSRWTIDKRYIGRNIWMAFPSDGFWYLVPHDEMLGWNETRQFQLTDSWVRKGIYHKPSLSVALSEKLGPYRLENPSSSPTAPR